jgi:hypothetical protein
MNGKTKDVKKSRSTSVAGDRRWTLLFIGNRGKTITFNNFKGVVLAAIGVLLVSAVVAGGFYYLYHTEIKKNASLQNDMDNLRQVVASLRNEKDILMARLVVAESRVEETLEKEEKPQSEPKPIKFASIDRQASESPADSQADTQLQVTVEDFIVFHEPDINTLRVQYKVINTGSKEQPVSGKTIVVLKNTDAEKNKWLPLPSVPLVAGKPSGQWGRSFSIFNFRTMRFKVNDQAGPDQFNTATVFIFSLAGDLLLEKDFAVGIKSQTISTQ